MAGRGSAPGERRGGRAPGTPNKRTIEEQERRRLEEEAKTKLRDQEIAQRAHIKLGKDVLEDYMQAFATLAAVYQNKIVASLQTGVAPAESDLDAFERWGKLAAGTAKDLAEFQSPKFKAIMVTSPGDQNGNPQPKTIDEKGNVIELNDPVAAARVYGNMVKAIRKR